MLNTFNALFIVKYIQTKLIRLFLLGKIGKTTLKTHKLQFLAKGDNSYFVKLI